MKRKNKILVTMKALTLAAAVAVMVVSPSCQKETAGTQDLVKEGETIQVNINAGLGGFVAADATKATATPVVRLEWSDTDKVQAYYGNSKVGTDLTVTPSENKIFAKLSGTITAPSGHTFVGNDIITFVYSNGCTIENNLTFNFSNQDTTIPFVAYATVKWSEIKSGLTDKMVEFKFATSVMKIAATGLDGSEISSATIDGINTKVTLAPQTSSGTVTIEGDTSGTITKTDGFDTSTDNTRAIFTVGLVPDDNTSRKLTINGKEADLTSSAIAASKSYTTPCAFEGVKDVAYVIIGGKKWATKNLGADKAEDFGKLYSWGNLFGQIENSENKFDLIFNSTTYNKTQSKSIDGSTITWNKVMNDAAYNEWGGSWRMPTKGDFLGLAAEGVWFWTSSYKSTGIKGYIVYVAQHSDDKGKANMNGTWKQWSSSTNSYGNCSAATGSYSESSDEHIFFPAAGSSDSTSRTTGTGGTYGYYWSSDWYSSDNASHLRFNDSNVYPQDYGRRYYGRSVRPVSD